MRFGRLNQSEYREACAKWMTEFDPLMMATFVFNRSMSIDEAQIAFERFHGQLDRRLVGRAFQRRPEKRSTYIATIEKPTRNIHIHALFKMTKLQELRFHLVAEHLWKKITISGHIDARRVFDAEGVADYISKELRPDTSDRVLLPRHIVGE